VAVALSLATLARRVRGATVRLAAGLCLALALLNPSLIEEKRAWLTSVAAVVVDRSQSQAIGDRTAETDAALAGLTERLGALDGVETRIIEARPGNGEAGDGTRLFEALANGLADVPPERVAGAVVLSDGLVHDIPATAADRLGLQRALACADHRIASDEIDRRIVMVDSPRFGIVGKEQNVRLRVVETGRRRAGGQVRLTVRRDGEIIDASRGRSRSRRCRSRWIDRGAERLRVRSRAARRRTHAVNNTCRRLGRWRAREPARAARLRRAARRRAHLAQPAQVRRQSVDLVHFTILRPPEKQDGTPINELSLIAFPTRELFSGEDQAEFDLIIFDRYANGSGILPLVYFDNIVRYVRDGGALLVAAGPEYSGAQSLARTPLGQILPAQPDGSVFDEAYRARVSEPGKRHPVTRDLPGSEAEPPRWGEWLRMVGARARSGSTVMTGPGDRPLLLLAREQKGRVALFLSDHAWLWARGFRDGGPHLDLLRRLGHWLMKEPDLEEEALRASARGRNIEIERQTLGENPGPATITAPDGSVRTVPFEAGRPGLFVARTAASEFGLHKITTENLTAFASVGPENPRELMEVVSDPGKLQGLAEATGGSSRRIGQENGSGVIIPRIVPVRSGRQFAGADWLGLRISDSGIVRGVSISPLFVGLIGLAILFGALVAGWIGESGRRFKREA
jgi:hypothetical protein